MALGLCLQVWLGVGNKTTDFLLSMTFQWIQEKENDEIMIENAQMYQWEHMDEKWESVQPPPGTQRDFYRFLKTCEKGRK